MCQTAGARHASEVSVSNLQYVPLHAFSIGASSVETEAEANRPPPPPTTGALIGIVTFLVMFLAGVMGYVVYINNQLEASGIDYDAPNKKLSKEKMERLRQKTARSKK